MEAVLAAVHRYPEVKEISMVNKKDHNMPMLIIQTARMKMLIMKRDSL